MAVVHHVEQRLEIRLGWWENCSERITACIDCVPCAAKFLTHEQLCSWTEVTVCRRNVTSHTRLFAPHATKVVYTAAPSVAWEALLTSLQDKAHLLKTPAFVFRQEVASDDMDACRAAASRQEGSWRVLYSGTVLLKLVRRP
ncbi:hypothetical protein Efla_006129 [Eimeria flavescens]